jgi:hypothetical protein
MKFLLRCIAPLVAAALVLIVLTVFNSSAVAIPTLVLILGLLIVSTALGTYFLGRDVLAPVVIVSVLFTWLYVAKPLYILKTGITSPGADADAYQLSGWWTEAMRQSLLLVIACFLLFVAGTKAVSGTRSKPMKAEIGRPQVFPSCAPTSFNWQRYWRVSCGALVLAAGSYLFLIQSAGGFSAYFSGLALRSESLAGVSFLTLTGVPVNICLFIGLAEMFGNPGVWTRERRAFLFIVFTSSVTIALLSGGRAALLTGCLLPVIVLVHYGRKRLSLARAGLLGAAAFSLLLVLGALLRDSTFGSESGRTPIDFIAARFADIEKSLLGGVEAVPMDTLMRLLGAQSEGDMTYQMGRTYSAILTWPIPRFLWAGKPAGGGNTWFTEEYVPRFYGTARVESSISFIGESYGNFGWIGVLLLSFVLGAMIQKTYIWMRDTPTSQHLSLYAALFGYFISVFRGDAYHNVTGVVFVFVIWALVSRYCWPSKTEGAQTGPARPISSISGGRF